MTIILDARTATDHFPGIGRYVANLAGALAGTRFAGQLTLLRDPSAAATRVHLPDLPQIACPVSPFSLRQQWTVPALLRRSGAKLYHSAYYLMPYLPGLPTVLTCYDLLPLFHPRYYSAAQRVIYWLTHLLATRTASRLLAISEATKADMVRWLHLEPSKIVVTPLAAGAHFQPQSELRLEAVRRQYGLPEQYVLYFGSNKPHKNLVRLVQAFGQAQISSTTLMIAGHWDPRYPEAKQLAAQAGWQDRVKFVGPVAEADLPALYAGATLFAFPSEYEGFGLPPLEAMACGTPVACSNTSSLPEVTGEAAALFNPLQVADIQAVLIRCLGDAEERARLRERGLERAKQFTWELMAQQTLEVYQTVLQQA